MPIEFSDVIVQYPMPAWCVPHVSEFLQKLHRERETSQTNPVAVAAAEPGWTIEDLRRLRPQIRHNRVAMAMLDMASEKEGQYVTFPDACARAGIELSQGRSGIGALTKVCNKIGKKGSWPVTYAWAGNGEQVACYLMNSDVAAKWRQVSGE